MTSVFRRTNISKEKLREIITKNSQSLLDGLVFIDLRLDADECGVIDFIGVDIAGGLVIIDFDVECKNDLLITALSQAYWLKKNQGLIKRLFFSENIDYNKVPKILLIAESFSSKLIAALE